MGLFRTRPAETATAPPAVAESLETLIQSSGQPSLFAHSDFVKQVTCARCGAPKRLPSKTAYLYCDHCGSLIDYDFRLANSGTNAGLTNTVYHQLVAPVQGDLDRARAAGDAGRCRELLRGSSPNGSGSAPRRCRRAPGLTMTSGTGWSTTWPNARFARISNPALPHSTSR